MTTIEVVKPKLEQFTLWLSERGAEVLSPASDFELLRFRTAKGVSAFCFKKSGLITFVGEADVAWRAFTRNLSWRAMPATPRRVSSKATIASIRERDGDLCFYCQEYVKPEDETEEHLVSLTHGGPQHIANKFLAHKVCNGGVGSLSAPEKIRVHVMAVLRKGTEKMKEFYVSQQQ